MKKYALLFTMILALIANPAINSEASAQEAHPSPKLYIGGGALPENMYKEFLLLTGENAKLVVVPTASNDDPDIEKIKEVWKSRGFTEISILHTREKEIASSAEFIAPLRTATAVWFSGGSQQLIADAYIGTAVEEELYKLINRGGVIGGSSAGAAIQTRVMIRGGGEQPKISTGLELLPGAIVDQHFLKRNRLARLIGAVRSYPELIGFGIDEGTAIIVSNNQYKVVGESYVLRFEMVEGKINIDAFEDGEIIPASVELKD